MSFFFFFFFVLLLIAEKYFIPGISNFPIFPIMCIVIYDFTKINNNKKQRSLMLALNVCSNGLLPIFHQNNVLQMLTKYCIYIHFNMSHKLRFSNDLFYWLPMFPLNFSQFCMSIITLSISRKILSQKFHNHSIIWFQFNLKHAINVTIPFDWFWFLITWTIWWVAGNWKREKTDLDQVHVCNIQLPFFFLFVLSFFFPFFLFFLIW